MNDLTHLAKSMENKVLQMRKVTSKLIPAVALEILKELEIATPVDTSKALSNWLVTIGSRSWAKVPAHIVGKQGSTRSQSIQESVSRAIIVMKNREPGQAVYIANNLDYIGKLNEGSSLQAPAGFIESATLKGRLKVKRFTFLN